MVLKKKILMKMHSYMLEGISHKDKSYGYPNGLVVFVGSVNGWKSGKNNHTQNVPDVIRIMKQLNMLFAVGMLMPHHLGIKA